LVKKNRGERSARVEQTKRKGNETNLEAHHHARRHAASLLEGHGLGNLADHVALSSTVRSAGSLHPVSIHHLLCEGRKREKRTRVSSIRRDEGRKQRGRE